ncbi:carboxypeptidase regulatory-like domain-containing protein [Pedobacter panaciterrae]
MSWATINIISSTNAIVKTGISDSTGIFTLSQIPSGTYKLEIVSIGYKAKTFAISLQDTTKLHVDQGLVLLSPDTKQLKGVNITKQQTNSHSRDRQACVRSTSRSG